ncbi:MAG: GAF domain-containing protein [Thermoleophilia bacterium]
MARGVLADLDLESVLERVLQAARELTGARFAALGMLDESRTELARFITAGIDDAARQEIGDLPRGRGVLGELIRHPVPLRLDDVGEHPRSYGFPPGHPPMKSFLGVPVLVAGEPFGNLYLTDKRDAARFDQDDEEALVALAELAGVAIDHARRYTGSEQRRGELQRTVEALDATLQLARALGNLTDLDAVLELVAKRGRALVSARALVIELVEGETLFVAATAGEVPPGIAGQRLGVEETVASTALRTRRPQRLDDELNRARFEQHGLGRFGLRASGGLVVPLIFAGRTYGVLVAVDRLEDGPAFSADDERLLEAFASTAATAVATAQSVAAERSAQRLAAAEQERGRWARELHDETLQALAALRLGLSAAARGGSADELATAVRQAVGQLDADIAGLRALITDLRPGALDELGTEAAIRALADRSRAQGLDVDLRVDLAHEQGRASRRLVSELEIAIYRIVQEALTNARKHGAARRAVVEVGEDESEIHIAVTDDGAGFDPTERTDGFGLLGIRERADLLGGTVSIDSAPGEGTTLSAALPVRRSDGTAVRRVSRAS